MGHFTTWVNLQAHLQAHPTVLLAGGFLDTEHLRKRELKSVRILLNSHIWSLCAEIHALTKSKNRSIAKSNHKSSIQEDLLSSCYFTKFISKVDHK